MKDALEIAITKYNPPIFTDKVLIEAKVVPHSHPVLTLNTRNTDPLLILATFVHEQFHWFASGENADIARNFLKHTYPDLGDCNTARYTDSFWEHLIVIWNTLNFLRSTLSPLELATVETDQRVYPLTNAFVRENFEQLRGELEMHGMIWKK